MSYHRVQSGITESTLQAGYFHGFTKRSAGLSCHPHGTRSTRNFFLACQLLGYVSWAVRPSVSYNNAKKTIPVREKQQKHLRSLGKRNKASDTQENTMSKSPDRKYNPQYAQCQFSTSFLTWHSILVASYPIK